jgi:hypothetical protein
MITYNTLAPLLGQALIRAHRDARPYHVVTRLGRFTSKLCIVAEIAPGDRVVVQNVGADALPLDAARLAWSRSPDDMRATLRTLRHVAGTASDTPMSAETIAAALWLLSCSLGTFERIEREEAAHAAEAR